jgi:hypothetical protein
VEPDQNVAAAAPEEARQEPGPTAPPLRIAVPLALLAAGIVTLVIATALAREHRASQPWRDAVGTFDGAPLWDDVIPITARSLPDENYPRGAGLGAELKAAAQSAGLVHALKLTKRERVVAITLPDEEWQRLTASGRAPKPGQAEVLAGALTRFDTFTMDGITFEVVGSLHRGVSGHGLSYLMPEDAAFEGILAEEMGATRGWFDPEGLARLADKQVSYDEEALEGVTMVGGVTPVPAVVTALCVAGLLAVALGGMAAQVRVFRILGGDAKVFRPVSSALMEHPVLLWTLHVLLYGTFFGFTALAIAYPLANMGLVEFVHGIFAEGSLKHVGDAYQEGRVVAATFWTWVQNFMTATVLLTIVPAVLIPFAGTVWAIAKHLLSFCLVGFVMAPLWSDSIGVLPFHSITMALELEAYVLAAFVATVFPIRIVKAAAKGVPWQGYGDGLRVLASGTLLAGVLLAVAALYEAVTLILMG